MGTNFYWKLPATQTPTGDEFAYDQSDPQIHIGKRSAAGLYCWDCDVTLCSQGESAIHTGAATFGARCPRCSRARDTGGHSPVMVELGFQPAAPERPRGVRGAASFSWAQDPERVKAVCRERPDDVLIENEYGDEFTGSAFLRMLLCNCPIEKTDSIGRYFS